MTRYFRQFFNADPMTELSEADAHASGTYAEQVGGALPHYRTYLEHRLHAVTYAGDDDPAPAMAHHRAQYPDVPAHIHSPPRRDEHGVQWRTWYVEPGGTVEKILDHELDAAGNYLKVSYRGPDAELRSYTEYHYDDEQTLTEVVTYNPDGTVLNRQDAD